MSEGRKSAPCLKYGTFTFAALYLAAAAATLGNAIWMLVSERLWSDVMDRQYITHGAHVLLAASILLLIGACFGMVGAIKEWSFCLIVFTALLLASSVLFITAGVIGAIAESQYPEELRQRMRSLIIDNYGTSTSITETFDYLQSTEDCCAVEDETWSVYHGSEWYRYQPGLDEADRPLVPLSCCVRDREGNFLDAAICQTSRIGPPWKQSGTTNPALHYRGCYEVVVNFLKAKATYIAGLGIGIGLCAWIGIVFSMLLFRKIRR